METPQNNYQKTLSLSACLFGLAMVSPMTQAVSPLSDAELSEQQASILPTRALAKKKDSACETGGDKEQAILGKAKESKKDACSGGGELSAKAKKKAEDETSNKDESDSQKKNTSADNDSESLNAQKNDKQSNTGGLKDGESGNNKGLNTGSGEGSDDVSASSFSENNLNNQGRLGSPNGMSGLTQNSLVNGSLQDGSNTDNATMADAAKMLSAAGLPSGILGANGNVLNQAALDRLNTLEAFNTSSTDPDKNALQQLTNIQNLQINSGADGSTTLTIKDPGTYESGYIYESVTGGGINKGDDIEIPSIRVGLVEVSVTGR